MLRRTGTGGHAPQGASDYPEEGNKSLLSVEETSFWFRHRNEVIGCLLDHYPTPGPLWDIGGGNGFQALFLQRRGLPVVLVEPGPEGCRNARVRGVETVIQARLHDLRLAQGSVAAFAFFDVLEHVPDPRSLLGEARRALRPAGRVYLTAPAYSFLWSDEDEYAHHQRRYSAKGLAADLAAAELEVEYLGYYFQSLVLPIFLLRTLPHWLRRRRLRERAPIDPAEHAPGAAARVLTRLLRQELAVIRRGGRLRCGASILAVARRATGGVCVRSGEVEDA